MKKAFLVLVGVFFALFSSSVFSQTPPYTITELTAEDAVVDLGTGSAQTEVSVECYDADGTEMVGQQVNLEFFAQNGTSFGTATVQCAGSQPNTPTLTRSGLYYVTAEFDCAPACCQAGGGCNARTWFALSRPLPILNIPDNNPLVALIVCLSVLFIVNKKE